MIHTVGNTAAGRKLPLRTQAIAQSLTQCKNLHSIVQKQWELIFQDLEAQPKPFPQWAVALRDRIRALPSDFDYRRRFAMRCLAPSWAALRNQAILNPGADVDLRNLIPALLINHLQARLQLPQTKTPTVDVASYSGFLPECDMRNQKSLQCASTGGPIPSDSHVLSQIVERERQFSASQLLPKSATTHENARGSDHPRCTLQRLLIPHIKLGGSLNSSRHPPSVFLSAEGPAWRWLIRSAGIKLREIDIGTRI